MSIASSSLYAITCVRPAYAAEEYQEEQTQDEDIEVTTERVVEEVG